MRIKFWIQQLGWGIAATALVFGAAFLCDARRQLMNAISDQDPGTVWTVVLSDEGKSAATGAALKNLEGVKNVELTTREEAYQRFLSEPSLKPPLQALNANPFHSYYKVSWDLRKTKPQTIEAQAQTVRQWPGVGSVADRSSQIKIAHALRLALAQMNIVLLTGLAGLILFSLLWVGSHLSDANTNFKTLLRITFWDGAFGAAGYGLAILLLGSRFPPLLGLGFLAGFIRSAGTRTENSPMAESSRSPIDSLQSEIS